jgi:hypothetical protein
VVSPPISDYRVTLWPDAAMRRAAALAAGPTDAGGAEFSERRRRIDQVLADVARELSLALEGADGRVEVDVGIPVRGRAPPDGEPPPTVEVRTWRGDPAPPEVVAHVRATFDALWARTIDAARRPRLPG